MEFQAFLIAADAKIRPRPQTHIEQVFRLYPWALDLRVTSVLSVGIGRIRWSNQAQLSDGGFKPFNQARMCSLMLEKIQKRLSVAAFRLGRGGTTSLLLHQNLGFKKGT